MNTDLTQRASATHVEALPALSRIDASRIELRKEATRPVPASHVVASHVAAVPAGYSAIPARICTLTDFAATTANPCVMPTNWLGGTKHEHQRLKERSLP